jgi:hypothetical protein
MANAVMPNQGKTSWWAPEFALASGPARSNVWAKVFGRASRSCPLTARRGRRYEGREPSSLTSGTIPSRDPGYMESPGHQSKLYAACA